MKALTLKEHISVAASVIFWKNTTCNCWRVSEKYLRSKIWLTFWVCHWARVFQGSFNYSTLNLWSSCLDVTIASKVQMICFLIGKSTASMLLLKFFKENAVIGKKYLIVPYWSRIKQNKDKPGNFIRVKQFVKVERLPYFTYMPFFIGRVGASPIQNWIISNCSSQLDNNLRLLCPQRRWCSEIFINNKYLQTFKNRCSPTLPEAIIGTMVFFFSFYCNFKFR